MEIGGCPHSPRFSDEPVSREPGQRAIDWDRQFPLHRCAYAQANTHAHSVSFSVGVDPAEGTKSQLCCSGLYLQLRKQ